MELCQPLHHGQTQAEAASKAAAGVSTADELTKLTQLRDSGAISVPEYEKLKAILGREPSYTELGIFSVMWSEHCSYKNSRPSGDRNTSSDPSALRAGAVPAAGSAPTSSSVRATRSIHRNRPGVPSV